MQTIYADINNTRDVFTFNLITSADIGEKKYNQIVDALDKASVVVEDILFELDNKNLSVSSSLVIFSIYLKG